MNLLVCMTAINRPNSGYIRSDEGSEASLDEEKMVHNTCIGMCTEVST
jgi:hypothetical protein